MQCNSIQFRSGFESITIDDKLPLINNFNKLTEKSSKLELKTIKKHCLKSGKKILFKAFTL